jgi:hypothetical protein
LIDLTQSRWLPIMGLTGANLFLSFARAAKPACLSTGGAVENSPQFQLRDSHAKPIQAPDVAKEISIMIFCRLYRGLKSP